LHKSGSHEIEKAKILVRFGRPRWSAFGRCALLSDNHFWVTINFNLCSVRSIRQAWDTQWSVGLVKLEVRVNYLAKCGVTLAFGQL
jgi:hypothetical protein